MTASTAYRARRRPTRTARTRKRILDATRDLLAEGSFHESTMEQVAERARLELVDGICDSFAVNPALLRIRDTVELADPDEALAETISATVRFWSSEDGILSQLYGVIAVDQAAQDLVDRQRNDRRGEMQRLVRHLRKSGRLRKGVSEARGLAVLMVLTSYESFRELRQAGVSDRELTKTLHESAHHLLLG